MNDQRPRFDIRLRSFVILTNLVNSHFIPSPFELCHSVPMQRSLLSRVWYELLKRSLQLLAVAVYRVRYSGRQNIPAEGGVLVVSNHQSHFDPPLVGIGCPRRDELSGPRDALPLRPVSMADPFGRRHPDRPGRDWPGRASRSRSGG